MATGHAYESDGGRALAGASTALMTGTLYKRSAELAAVVGPYDGYMRTACQGRPVTEDALAQLGQRVEEAVRATGSAELITRDVGLAVLGPLQEFDLVAYLRFASVYRAFDSLEDFEAAERTRERRAPRGAGPVPCPARWAASYKPRCHSAC
jgi:hypothetical protein